MNIVFLDEYSVDRVNLDPIRCLGNFTGYYNTEPEQVVERCLQAEVIISNKVKLTGEILDKLPRLRLICIAATGMNNVDLVRAAEKGIPVRNVPGYSTNSVAEATFTLLFALMRQTVYHDRFVKSGKYTESGLHNHFGRPFFELCGKSWGIIGMGTIGKRVAALAEAFGAKISYYSTSGKNMDAGYPCMNLEDLIAGSDIISIHAPLNHQTYHLIAYEQMKRMKSTAFLINVARGKIIHEPDLARALNENLIAGAGLDVFAQEPIEKENPLLCLENPDKIVLMPHIAWASVEARQALIDRIAEHIRQAFSD